MTKCLQISLIAEQKQAGQGLNTFSWVICKCQSGNGAERGVGREGEKPEKGCSNNRLLHPQNLGIKRPRPDPGPEQAERREGRESGGRGWDTEEVGTRVEGARVEGDGGGRVAEEETESGKTV